MPYKIILRYGIGADVGTTSIREEFFVIFSKCSIERREVRPSHWSLQQERRRASDGVRATIASTLGTGASRKHHVAVRMTKVTAKDVCHMKTKALMKVKMNGKVEA